MKTYFYILIFVLLSIASSVFAATTGEFVVCNGPNCTFNDLVKLIEKLIDFIIKLSPLVAAIGFGVAGFYYLTDQGSGKGKAKAHDIFYWTLIGFVVILASWLVVRAILVGLGVNDQFILIK